MIDIPEREYERFKKNQKKEYSESMLDVNIIANGTPIPDNATNGDVIKAIFPNTEVDDYDYGKDPVIDVYGIDNTEYITLRKDWWNAPYKKGGK
jgi:hypothetical protein